MHKFKDKDKGMAYRLVLLASCQSIWLAPNLSEMENRKMESKEKEQLRKKMVVENVLREGKSMRKAKSMDSIYSQQKICFLSYR